VHASPPNMSPFQRRMIIVTYNALSNAPLAQSNQMQRPDFLNGRNRSALQTISE
jgi:ectoine hydroxylase